MSKPPIIAGRPRARRRCVRRTGATEKFSSDARSNLRLKRSTASNIGATIAELKAKGVGVVGEPGDEGYGITIMLNLPGGCQVMLYEPRHPVAAGM